MDRRKERGITRLSVRKGNRARAGAVGGLLICTLVAASSVPPPLQMLDWTDRSQHLLAAASRPRTCLADSADGAEAEAVARGAVLFQSPALLGGQAARARLSCASCHNSGRDNPHFFLSGISDRPGTADVTASFFGTARANGRFDPVRIPDLTQPGRISRDPATSSLERFIRILIVDEFSGDEPDGASLGALSAYVRAVQPCADEPDGRVPIELDDQLGAVRAGIRGILAMEQAGQPVAVRQLVAATRHQLGLIDERYAGPRSGTIRSRLSRYSMHLAAVHDGPGDAATKVVLWSRWLDDFEHEIVPMLERRRNDSLYNASRLETALRSR